MKNYRGYSILSRGFVLLSCCTILTVSCKKEASLIKVPLQGGVSATGDGKNIVSNELLVKFKAGTSEEVRTRLLSLVTGTVSQHILTRAMEHAGDNSGIYLIHTSMATEVAIEKLKGLEQIVYAEPNYVYTTDVVSNDAYFTNGSLWGMYGTGTSPSNNYGSQAAVAWGNGHTGSSSVIVAVIDEGIMNTHPDLAANCWTNSFDPVNGVDDDGNGYVDDKFGWDFVSNDNSTYDGAGDDHATHVAGTIGAVGGNSIGVAGVNWNVKMMSCKFLGSSGGTTANAILAVDYVTDMKTSHSLNIVATNNSWGGGGYSQGLADAIDRANNAGILFIAAAGNSSSNNDATASYPSNYGSANVIAVASITSTGGLSSFSNYGLTSVDIGAPGSNIYSTLPPSNPSKKAAPTYGSYSGTSMATPHVTGAAALYAAHHPGSTASAIKAAILSAATPTTSLSGKCTTGGRLNVSAF